jgi:hypothetical protein
MSITAVHSNAVTLTWSFYNGGVNFKRRGSHYGYNGNLPSADLQLLPFVQFFWALDEFRASLPYGVGTFQGTQFGGGTASLPVSKHQSIKISYSTGTYIRFGGNYQSVAVAWQYSWIGWPKRAW